MAITGPDPVLGVSRVKAPTAKPHSPPTPGNRWPKLERVVETGTGICVCVWFFKKSDTFLSRLGCIRTVKEAGV